MTKHPSKDQASSSPNDVENLPKTEGPADGCPRWATVLIDEIRALEIRLGNIRTADDETKAWQASKLGDVLARLNDESHAFDESVVESHFRQISRRLLGEGFSADDVAGFVNARIPTGGRLSYCNAAEVLEAAQAAAPEED